MSVWSVQDWEDEVGKFNYYRSVMVSAALRTCTTDADIFMQNLRDRVFDLDEVLWIEHLRIVAPLFMYMMISSGDAHRNLAPHVVRQGCVIDMDRFFWWNRRLVNPMGFAIIHARSEVVLAMMQRGFSCTAPCAKEEDGKSYMDAVELVIKCSGGAYDSVLLRRMLDVANLPATQLTKYLRGLKPSRTCMAKVFNEAIDNARSQEPYYAATWIWKDARETKNEWRDVLHGHVMPVLRTLGMQPLHTDPEEARLRGMRQKRDARGWEEDDNNREVHMRPNKLRKI